MQQVETRSLEDVKAKSLWEERFDPEKAFAPEKSAEDIKLDYENMKGDIQWSKDVVTPGIEKKLADVMTEGEDVVQKYQAAGSSVFTKYLMQKRPGIISRPIFYSR